MNATEWRPGLAPSFRSPGEWGIEPVSWDHRRLGFWDYAVLWGDLGVGLLVLLAGSVLVPALGLRQAVLAILVGSAAGVLLLALVGLVGSDTGVPTMVLLRPALGLRGSYVPTILNILQLIGWGAFEILVMAQAADAITGRLAGGSAFLLWVVLLGVFCTVLALGGPVAVVRRWLETCAVWFMLGTTAWLTYAVVAGMDVGTLWRRPGDGGMTFWRGVDLVIAMPVSWLPLAADYSRFAAGGRRAFWGTAVGYSIANVWFYGLGALLLLGVQSGDLIAAILGLAGGWLAMLVILVDETDEAFADIYSAALSVQNIFPRWRQRWLVAAIGAVCMGLAAVIPLARYEHFLLAIGSVFVPLFGVLAGDYFLLARRRYDLAGLFQRRGTYWFAAGFRWQGFVAWGAGVATFQALAHWAPAVGSSLPSAVVACAVHAALGPWSGAGAGTAASPP